MKKLYAIQVIDLLFQFDHITLSKIHLFEEQRVAPNNARVIVILLKHRQKMTSGGHKFA